MLTATGISAVYVFAALIAALVRLLILTRQPPPPRPSKYEIFRQMALTFIFVVQTHLLMVQISGFIGLLEYSGFDRPKGLPTH